MHRKGPRAIPDFSRKPRPAAKPGVPAQRNAPAPHAANAVSKPQGPALKPGRRGQ